MKIFVNGKIVNQDQAVISVFDHGFLYGFGLFETIRAYNGRPFLFNRHYKRLNRSADAFQIKMTKTAQQLYEDICLTLRENHLLDAYIRITLSGGDEGLGLWGKEHGTPNWIIMAKPIGEWSPVKGLITLDLRRSTSEGTFRMKSVSFANNMLAKKELNERGKLAEEGIFLSHDGYIVEGTVSNIFFVRKGILYTPHEDTGLLPGVTRGFIMDLSRQLELKLYEGFFKMEELYEADEVFITNSIQEIVPVHQINGVEIPTTGLITQRLMNAYRLATQEQGDVDNGSTAY